MEGSRFGEFAGCWDADECVLDEDCELYNDCAAYQEVPDDAR